MQSTIREISLEFIDDPANPMRAGLDKDTLNELADSIRDNGLINPITVRPRGDRFEVVAGHRRFRACGIAGVFKIPCVVSEVNDTQAENIMAAENLNRQDVNPVEEALFLGKMVGEDFDKIPDVARRLNRSLTWVEDRLELLKFSDRVLSALRDGKIKLGVAQWLGRVDSDFWQEKFIDQAIGQGMSIFQARYLHDQFAMGILAKETDIMPDMDGIPVSQRPKVKVVCARCKKMAEEPNFQSVFIHLECPDEQS